MLLVCNALPRCLHLLFSVSVGEGHWTRPCYQHAQPRGPRIALTRWIHSYPPCIGCQRKQNYIQHCGSLLCNATPSLISHPPRVRVDSLNLLKPFVQPCTLTSPKYNLQNNQPGSRESSAGALLSALVWYCKPGTPSAGASRRLNMGDEVRQPTTVTSRSDLSTLFLDVVSQDVHRVQPCIVLFTCNAAEGKIQLELCV